MVKEQRLLDIYTAAAIALLFLMSTLEAAWVAAFALALVVSGLLVFPAHRPRIIAVGAAGAAAGLVVAALVRVL